MNAGYYIRHDFAPTPPSAARLRAQARQLGRLQSRLKDMEPEELNDATWLLMREMRRRVEERR